MPVNLFSPGRLEWSDGAHKKDSIPELRDLQASLKRLIDIFGTIGKMIGSFNDLIEFADPPVSVLWIIFLTIWIVFFPEWSLFIICSLLIILSLKNHPNHDSPGNRADAKTTHVRQVLTFVGNILVGLVSTFTSILMNAGTGKKKVRHSDTNVQLTTMSQPEIEG